MTAPPRSLADIQHELDDLVDAGILTVIVDGDGTCRYMRTEATDD